MTGGGFETSVPSESGPFVFESYRPDNRTWRASVGSGPDAKDASVTAYAVCRRGAPNLVPIYAAGRVPLFNPPVIGAVDIGAACPPGWRAVAGGFRGEVDINSGAALPQSSQRTDKRTWTNTAFAIGDEDGLSPSRLQLDLLLRSQGPRAGQHHHADRGARPEP